MYKFVLILIILLLSFPAYTDRRVTAFDTDSLLLETDGIHARVEILSSGEIKFNNNLFLNDDKSIRFKELSSNGNNYVELKSPSNISDDFTLTLPAFASAGGDVLVSNSSNELTWKHLPKVCIISESRDKGTDGDAAIKGEQDRKFDSTFLGNCGFFTRGSLVPDSTFISNNYFTQFELSTGYYLVQCNAFAHTGTNANQLYLWNVTTNQIVSPAGLSGRAPSIFVSVAFELTSYTNFKLIQYGSKNKANGLGIAVNATNSDREVYATCVITKFY